MNLYEKHLQISSCSSLCLNILRIKRLKA
uniref:Uncharacterized protein n=1 Tax=Arundo donax TaxID=35708 RepID=A0A0A9GKK4_ARUDO